MIIFESDKFSEIYETILDKLLKNPKYKSSPRGQKIHETLNMGFKLENPLNCLYDNEKRSSQYKYIAAETIWYFMGDNTPNFISKYAKMWNEIKNKDNTINSAYGYLVFNDTSIINTTQWNWCLNSLLNDKDTRQAIMHFNNPTHQFIENKDFVCTMYAIFHIRDNKLNMTVHMRSQDVILGLPTDLPFFILLQQQLLNHLKTKYNDLELGTYTHIVDSLHLYERNFDLVNNMLQYDFINNSIPILNKNIINIEGKPEYDFIELSTSLDDITYEYDKDNLYKWIYKNITHNK